jgi:hypothetical protein
MGLKEFDSPEERHFSWYLEELVKLGVISTFTNDIPPFILNKEYSVNVNIPMKRVPDKIKKKTFIKQHVYTPDFVIFWDNKVIMYKKLTDVFTFQQADNGLLYSYIEVKPMFDQNNMTRLFTSRTQPWVWDKYNKYVQLVKVPRIFKKTFTPERYLKTDKTGKPRSIKFPTRTLLNYLNT